MHKIDASWFHPRIKPSDTSKITRERIPEQISSQTQYREWKHESERGPVLATKVLNNNERFSLQGVTVFILSRSLSPQSFLLCQCQSLLILKCCVNKIPERRGRKTFDFFFFQKLNQPYWRHVQETTSIVEKTETGNFGFLGKLFESDRGTEREIGFISRWLSSTLPVIPLVLLQIDEFCAFIWQTWSNSSRTCRTIVGIAWYCWNVLTYL